jgi:hypothetical protein
LTRQGDFNVPFGCKSGTRLVDADVVRACSQSLEKAVLTRDELVATLYQPSHTKQLVESAEKSIHDLSTNTVRLNTETNRQPLW